ncbi:hypothetical protein B296_00017299 [Ensete ventricosum]|uniref:Uncharacterized protein n=1 Tax=Ensete ventricosum TaxID=4639 RepID=A0A427B0M7_ENSVE|nr:hypothetical protein B296_00017299 [Ensete ventricosum]
MEREKPTAQLHPSRHNPYRHSDLMGAYSVHLFLQTGSCIISSIALCVFVCLR